MEIFRILLVVFVISLIGCDAPSLLLSPSLHWHITDNPKEIIVIHGPDNMYPTLKKITLDELTQKSDQNIYFYSNITLPEDVIIDQLVSRDPKNTDFVFDTEQNAFYFLGMIDLDLDENVDSCTIEHYISHPENYIFAVPESQSIDVSVLFEFQRLGSDEVPETEVIEL